MKSILVPMDFSDCAKASFHVALKMARLSKAEIILAHIYERPVYGFVDLAIDNDKNRQIRKEIDRQFSIIASEEDIKGVIIKKFVMPDRDIEGMVKHEKLSDVDLIIMGSQGKDDPDSIFSESNAEVVVRTARCPVLIIKDDIADFAPKDVVFASNFAGEAVSSFGPIKAFTDLTEATVHLVKVITPDDFETTARSHRLMKDFAEDVDLRDFTINTWNDVHVDEGAVRFSQHINADVIAMETHGRQGIAHLINGSLTEKVANISPIPVLSVRIKNIKPEFGVIFP